MSFAPVKNVRDLRKKLGLTQVDFWASIGITQSSGSRYESGRNIPKPVRELIRLVYIENIDLAKLNQLDLTIASLLREQQPELYEILKKEVKNKKKEANQ